MTSHFSERDVTGAHPAIVFLTPIPEQEAQRKAHIERRSILDFINLVVAEFDGQTLDVALEMLYFPSAYDWEDVRRFMHYVCQRNAGNLGVFSLRDFSESGSDFLDILRLLASPAFVLLLKVFPFPPSPRDIEPYPRTRTLEGCHAQNLGLRRSTSLGKH